MRRLALSTLAAAFTTLATAASATVVTTSFQAMLVPFSGDHAGPYNIGDEVNVTITYDTAADTNTTPPATSGDYSLIGSVVVSNGITSTTFDQNGVILVSHDFEDSLIFEAYSADNLRFDFTATAPGGSVFSDASLPASLDLSKFSLSGSIFEDESATLDMAFELPEPASVSLFGLALAGLLARRRRRGL